MCMSLTSKNHLTSDGERDNSRVFEFEKNHILEKNSEFRVIVYCPIPKYDNSELGKCIFYGIAKILSGPVGFGRNQTNLAYAF